MWANICRICSSRAEYDIFAKIPAYLHATSNEFLNWQKHISVLLEETTGLVIDQKDGLPTKMCALCISYLKHAVTFRQQAINNTLSLKAITALTTNNVVGTSKKSPIMCSRTTNNDTAAVRRSGSLLSHEDKEKVLVTANDLIFNEQRKTDTNSLVNKLNNHNNKLRCKNDEYTKSLLLLNQKNDTNNSKNQNILNNCANPSESDDIAGEIGDNNNQVLTTYLNLLFDKGTNEASGSSSMWRKTKRFIPRRVENSANFGVSESDPFAEEFQTASSDDNEACEQKKNFFSYKEKNFKEDDIMDLDELKDANITINIPETCKERKCRACFRRFMFEESYTEHMDTCIEYKFLTLMEEINRLFDIRRSKAVSPHELIRRMIFCLRKTCQWLQTSCGEFLLPDLLLNGEGEKKRMESEGKSSATDVSSGCGKSDKEACKRSIGLLHDLKCSPRSNNAAINESTSTKNSLLELLQNTADSSFKILPKNKFDSKSNILNLLQNDEETTSGSSTNNSSNFYLNPIKPSESDNELSTENEYKPKFETFQIKNDFKSEERLTFLQKLKNANTKPKKMSSVLNIPPGFDSPSTSTMQQASAIVTFSARCNMCSTLFDSVASLEEHNASFHNMLSKYEEHKKIIALFEEYDDDNNDSLFKPLTKDNTGEDFNILRL